MCLCLHMCVHVLCVMKLLHWGLDKMCLVMEEKCLYNVCYAVKGICRHFHAVGR